MFSCEFREIFKNTFFQKTPLIAVKKVTTMCKIGAQGDFSAISTSQNKCAIHKISRFGKVSKWLYATSEAVTLKYDTSQEATSTGVFLNKVEDFWLATFLKKKSDTEVYQ